MKDVGNMRVVSMEEGMARLGQIGLDILGGFDFKIDAKDAVAYVIGNGCSKAGDAGVTWRGQRTMGIFRPEWLDRMVRRSPPGTGHT